MEKQIIKENYAIYNNDCMNVVKELEDNSIDLSVYSPKRVAKLSIINGHDHS